MSDAIRTAHLTLDGELRAGSVTGDAIQEALRGVTETRRPAAFPIRVAQRLGQKSRLLDGISSMFGEAIAVRRAVLDGDDETSPRFLVRVDEFPYSSGWEQPERYGVDATRAFHEVLVDSGVPYLMAVLPQPAFEYLDPLGSGSKVLDDAEVELLNQLRADGVAFAQHGVTHRTRFRSPRRRSEFGGLGDDVGPLLDEGRTALREWGIETRVLVPPFNRFDGGQWSTLAGRYGVITGGPESVPIVGAQPTPTWWGDAVYLPCYEPLYADAATVLGAVDRVMSEASGCWVPLVLHTAWEIDDGFVSLRDLVRRIAPFAVSWSAFLEAVDRSRGERI